VTLTHNDTTLYLKLLADVVVSHGIRALGRRRSLSKLIFGNSKYMFIYHYLLCLSMWPKSLCGGSIRC